MQTMGEIYPQFLFWLLCSWKSTNPLLPPSQAHIRDYRRPNLHSGSVWFVLIHNECIMNDNCLLCGLKVPAVTVYVSVHTEPGLPWSQEPPSSGSASWCVRMCGFFYFAKSTVLGRGTEALPQIHFPRKSFISFNPSTLPKLRSLPPSATPFFECFRPATLTVDL